MSDEPKDKTPKTEQDTDPDVTGGRFSRIGLPMMLTICIGIALALVATSIGMYYSSNLSRIDLSKPRYADVRVAITPDADSDSDSEELDSSSPITEESVRQALEDMKAKRESLQGLGDFSSPVLDDAALGIGR